MLQVINKYYRSVLGIFFSALIALSMLFFGMDFGGGQSERYAIKVNDREVSFGEFANRKQEVRQRFAQSLGENYTQFAAQFLEGLNQRLVDSLVNEVLLEDFANEIGLSSGKNSVAQMIRSLFPDGYTEEKYSQLLKNMGTSAGSFEHRLAKESLRSQLESLFQHSAVAPVAEAKLLLTREKTQHDLAYVVFKPEDFLEKVTPPSEEELSAYFDIHVADYEIAERVSFRYAEVLPVDFEDTVEVFPEDIELYYSDNQKQFRIPERLQVQEISLKKPSEESPGALLGVSSLAEEIEEKAKAGEDFTALQKEYSDKKSSPSEQKWVMKGDRSAQFDSALFADPEIGKIGSVELGSEIVIFKVIQYEEESVQPLEEVSEEISQAIKKREAPAYAAVTAQEIFDQWYASDDSLKKAAKAHDLTLQPSAGIFSFEEAPEPLKLLTRRVLEVPEQMKQIVELQDKSVLVEIKKYEEAHYPELEEVRTAVVEKLTEERARELAQVEAQSFFAKVSESEKSLLDLAKDLKLNIETKENYVASAEFTGPLADESIKRSLSVTNKTGLIGEGAFSQEDSFVVAAVTKITPPKASEVEEALEEYRKVASNQLSQTTLQSLLFELRENAEIDVSPAVFNQ